MRLALLVLCVASASGLAIASPTLHKSIVKNVPVPGLKNGMDYCLLGNSDLLVSRVCMGTMTFGNQNTLDEGVEQLTKAFDEYGVNFLDTAEMYPVPTNAETQGLTDKAVAQFLKTRERKDVILATKVSGRSDRITWLRPDGETTKVNKANIEYSIEESLKRLETHYIDLLQVHWPERYVGGLFGQPDYDPIKHSEDITDFEEQLEALNEAVKSGKVRWVGVSNETPFGVMKMVGLAERYPDLYPRIVSIQNSYSLLVRKDYEAGLSEVCADHNCNIGLLAYSPLAAGVLTAKYSKAEVDPKARLKQFKGYMERYKDSQVETAVKEYEEVAKKHGISPTALALSWCYHRHGIVASTIIGATTMEQLEQNLKAYDVNLNDTVIEDISKVYKKYVDPSKAYN